MFHVRPRVPVEVDKRSTYGRLVKADYRVNDRGGGRLTANDPKYDLTLAGSSGGTWVEDGFDFAAGRKFASPQEIPNVTGDQFGLLVCLSSSEADFDWRHVVSCRDAGGGPSNFSLEMLGGTFYIWSTISSGFVGWQTTNTINDGTFKSILVYRDGGNPSFYINGTLDVGISSSGTWSGTTDAATSHFCIGGAGYATGSEIDSTIIHSFTVFDGLVPNPALLSARPYQFLKSNVVQFPYLATGSTPASGLSIPVAMHNYRRMRA